MPFLLVAHWLHNAVLGVALLDIVRIVATFHLPNAADLCGSL
jgi:hypothetical protein